MHTQHKQWLVSPLKTNIRHVMITERMLDDRTNIRQLPPSGWLYDKHKTITSVVPALLMENHVVSVCCDAFGRKPNDCPGISASLIAITNSRDCKCLHISDSLTTLIHRDIFREQSHTVIYCSLGQDSITTENMVLVLTIHYHIP